jgi:hypothetical protein
MGTGATAPIDAAGLEHTLNTLEAQVAERSIRSLYPALAPKLGHRLPGQEDEDPPEVRPRQACVAPSLASRRPRVLEAVRERRRCQAWAKNLVVGDGKDWYFDPKARRFRSPGEVPAGPVADASEVETSPPAVAVEAITVFELTERYWTRKWPSLEPKGREELGRYLNRLRRFFVTKKPDRSEAACLDVYLRTLSLSVRTTPVADSKVPWRGLAPLPLGARHRDRPGRARCVSRPPPAEPARPLAPGESRVRAAHGCRPPPGVGLGGAERAPRRQPMGPRRAADTRGWPLGPYRLGRAGHRRRGGPLS